MNKNLEPDFLLQKSYHMSTESLKMIKLTENAQDKTTNATDLEFVLTYVLEIAMM